ncbi:MAG: cupin domain-containing protein, partial [Acetobacteraceae bacterium]
TGRAGVKKSAAKRPAARKAAAPKSPARKTSVAGKAAPKKATAKAKSAPGRKAAAMAKSAATRKVSATARKSPVKAKAAPAKVAPRKAPVKATAKARASVQPRKSAARSIVKPRRARATPPAKRAPALPTSVTQLISQGGPQRFIVSHLNEADFKADGLRPYARYRDLGIAEATGGLCQAHVIRFVPPCTDEVRKRHTHETEIQLIYVLKGWIKNEFEGHGEQMMSVGSCWLQPSGIRHTVLDYSADCEVLEIIVPADFKTAEVADAE